MNELLLSVFGGFAGGFIRASVGVLKYYSYFGKKRFAVQPRYLFATLLASSLLGIIAGLFVENDMRFAILAGYAGTDFLEGLYKIQFRKRYGWARK
ncbi:MAG: hypothetical protein HYY37_03495 [Candidatus Aenigmarchaeota archaeon]|nr:hypothetical protein [Candidatus Aenigmarchaeota archaeon]